MKKIIRLTERDLTNIVKRIISEREFSPNRIKYGKSMRGGMDSFRERRIPNSEFDEGDVVVMSDNGHSGTILNVMFDHDDQKFYYEVRVRPEMGNPYRREVTADEIEINTGQMNEGEEYDFNETSAKLLGKYFTEKQGFEYIGNNGDKEMYALKKRGFSLVVSIMPDEDPSKARIMIHISLPMGKKINYLDEVDGRTSMVVRTDDYRTLFKYLQGALDFGRKQFDLDTLPPLPKF